MGGGRIRTASERDHEKRMNKNLSDFDEDKKEKSGEDSENKSRRKNK